MTITKVSSLLVLVLGLLGTPLLGQEIPPNLGIPRRFENYETKGRMLPPKNIHLDGDPFYIQRYSLGKDGKADVEEFYQVLGTNKSGSVITAKNPLLYSFDLNNNGQVDDDELLVDIERDGLNGNEEWGWMMMKRVAEQDTLRI